MGMRIVLELSDQDLNHFHKLAKQAMAAQKKLSEQQIIERARALIEQIDAAKAPQFIRDRVQALRLMIDMLQDEGWGMQEVGRRRVRTALAYFTQADDLVPDHIPGIGFLDDAIMIELLARELKPELDAYRDFIKYREAAAKRLGKDPDELNRSDYLKARERELLSRMRRRRRQGGGRSGSGRSPLALL